MIANKIRSIRILKGYSQEFMGEKLGIGQSAYSKLENSTSAISFAKLQKIAVALDCTTNQIMSFGENEALEKRIAALESQVNALIAKFERM